MARLKIAGAKQRRRPAVFDRNAAGKIVMAYESIVAEDQIEGGVMKNGVSILAKRALRIALVISLLYPVAVNGQTEPPSPEVKAIAGYSKVFLDETGHFAVGGSMQFYLTRRFGIEPEFLYMRGSEFEEWSFVPNLVYHFTDPEDRASPYLTGGAGFLRCYQKSIDFSTNELTANAGLGVKLSLSKRFFISPEIRFGTHAFPRATVRIGYSLSSN